MCCPNVSPKNSSWKTLVNLDIWRQSIRQSKLPMIWQLKKERKSEYLIPGAGGYVQGYRRKFGGIGTCGPWHTRTPENRNDEENLVEYVRIKRICLIITLLKQPCLWSSFLLYTQTSIVMLIRLETSKLTYQIQTKRTLPRIIHFSVTPFQSR